MSDGTVINYTSQILLPPCASGNRYGELPIYGYIISSIVLLFIWIVGTVGNAVVIFLIARNRELHTPINFLLCNLALAEFLITAFGTPINFVSAVYGAWFWGETGCISYGFAVGLGAITSIMTLTLLALERFLMILRLVENGCLLTSSHSLLIISGIWAYSLFLTFPRTFGGWTAFSSRAACLSCSVHWESDAPVPRLIRFILTFALPTGVIIVSYLGILLTVIKSGMGQAVRKAEFRVGLMVAMMCLAFIIAWCPYAVSSLMMKSNKGSQVLDLITTLFAKTSTCYNPVIYVGLNTQFRVAWRKFLGREVQRRRDLSFSETIQGGDNNERKTEPQLES